MSCKATFSLGLKVSVQGCQLLCCPSQNFRLLFRSHQRKPLEIFLEAPVAAAPPVPPVQPAAAVAAAVVQQAVPAVPLVQVQAAGVREEVLELAAAAEVAGRHCVQEVLRKV